MPEPASNKRVVIEHPRPCVDHCRFPVKRRAGDMVLVWADIFTDGHDSLQAHLLSKKEGQAAWHADPMHALGNDLWQGEFSVPEPGIFFYTIQAWLDDFLSWQSSLYKKLQAADQDLEIELQIGATLMRTAASRAKNKDRERLLELSDALTEPLHLQQALELALSQESLSLTSRYPDPAQIVRYSPEVPVQVDRKLAGSSAWYELFPRSCPRRNQEHGSLKDVQAMLPEIAEMGFDVLYLPPIHPIGRTNRKGRNNSLQAGPQEPGSPWAIGSELGGHKEVHPELGDLQDVQNLIQAARNLGLEIALDLAFQCSPDHPYLGEHPEWFFWRPDGSVQYAENPPKKYQDVVPFNFDSPHWRELWLELKDVVQFWIKQGINIFRVDNPHTKPFSFWEWLIREIKKDYPEAIFLAEAFTRPKVMHRLAKLGFCQSYTYFTWRNSKFELEQYLQELNKEPVKDYMRPNFWPNTPDILPELLQFGGRPAFVIRLVLAATLSSNYGIYGPAFELCENRALPGREEYLDSEKFELKHWDWDQPGNLKEFISRLNQVRKQNPALQHTDNLRFLESGNEQILCYSKSDSDTDNFLLIAVNLDPFQTQTGMLQVPMQELGLEPDQPYLVRELLGDDKYIWTREWNQMQMNPHILPAQIFSLHKRRFREQDFDYFL